MDDMIIIINVDYIRRRMEGRAIPSDVLFHSSHLGPKFRVLVPRLSVPNRFWNAMGSPFLTYLASNISSGGPSRQAHYWTRPTGLSSPPRPRATTLSLNSRDTDELKKKEAFL